MKVVCVVTSSRADYGLLKPVISKLSQEEDIELRLVATGSHLSNNFGLTKQEITFDGFPIHKSIPILDEDPNVISTSRAMAKALIGFSHYFEANRPDILVVLGDRFEILAVCIAATNHRVPIAHIHGGETTEGAVDECFRHSITKMSYLHFAACETYRKRIIQLGEDPSRVFNVGSLGVENVLRLPLLRLNELAKDLNFSFDRPYIVVTIHPVTLEERTEHRQCEELFKALDHYPQWSVLITKSNADCGGDTINRMIDTYVSARSNCKAFASLGALRYLSVVKYAKFIIGNSSSGIYEAPALGVPTINIGDRQKGRIRPDSVIDCDSDCNSIIEAIKFMHTSIFKNKMKTMINPYGAGEASANILKQIRYYLFKEKIYLKKKFFDISFELE